MLTFKPHKRRGFTLVELLIVVLILATLMAVGLPIYLSSVTDARKKACRANLQSIANAAQAWKVKHRARDFTELRMDELLPDLGATPACPDGGEYTLTTTGSVKNEQGSDITIQSGYLGISCSYGDHHGFIHGMMNR